MKNKENRRVNGMLKRFEVTNFKGFKDTLVFDLSARDYAFNSGIVKQNIVNKAIIYGKNGIGKSSLGIALFDVISHLTDKESMPPEYLTNYRNLETDDPGVTFKYYFVFDEEEVVYEYVKIKRDFLFCETLTINGQIVVDYCYFSDKPEDRYVDRQLIGDLNIDLSDNKLSVIKYIYRNTPTNTVPGITKMVKFFENMLWYRSLSDGNSYAGFTNGASTLSEMLYEKGNIEDFSEFLKENGMNYTLEFEESDGKHTLMAVFNEGKRKTKFTSVASTGTNALFLFYAWSISAFDQISLLFIDEFDAFFHYESAESIVKRLNSGHSFQTILTTHNTYLMQNKLTRPDCCYIMTKNKVSNLYDATDKEIREAHNLEKMYINGAFRE